MSAEFITRITVNGFLIIIDWNELIKNRRLTPIQLPLICIGMSRFCLQVVFMVQSFFSVFFPVFYLTKIYDAAMIFLWMIFLVLSVSGLPPAFLYFIVSRFQASPSPIFFDRNTGSQR